MKFSYSQAGEDALLQLKNQSERAFEIQRGLLTEILRQNADTEIGRRLCFSAIHSVKEYQQKVPISSYNEYADAILRILAGEKNILTADDPVYFSLTSGTTGEPKYLPVTETDLNVHRLFAYNAIFGMVKEYYKDLPDEKIFSKIFQVGEFVETFLPDGRMNGIRSSSLYQWLNRDGSFDTSDYCAPREVIFPHTLEDLTYVKARFALACRDVRCIHGVFIHRMTGMLRYMEKNLEMLLHDMETGQVSSQAGISPQWKAFVEKRLPPDPERAAELRGLSQELGIALRVWPELKYVIVIGGSAFAPYMEILRRYMGDVPIHYFAYAASEGIFAVAPGLNRPDEYWLIPEAGIFEFLPVDSPAGTRPLMLWELEKGMRCELIFTNRSGLYRYAMGDVLEVIGFYGEAPLVKFCYRKNQAINLANEMMTTEDLEKAIQHFEEEEGISLDGRYCFCGDYSHWIPCYKLYIEGENLESEKMAETIDRCLCSVCWGYEGCRRIGEIGLPQVVILPQGSFAAYDQKLAEEGRFLAQRKPLRVLSTRESKQWFEQLEEMRKP